MGDPVTMAVVGGTIGAATSDDPLKGALMGAAGGYAGGSLMGAGGLAGTGGGFGSGGGSLFGFETPFSGIGRFIDPITSAPIFGQGGIISNIGQAAGAYNQFGQALGLGQQPRMASLGASVRPGSQIQPVDYMSLLNPQQQTVLRPTIPSLI